MNALGAVAGLLPTTSFVPQVRKARRDGHADGVSPGMYVIAACACVLWIAYGALLGTVPMPVSNTIGLGLAASVLWSKLRPRRGRAGASVRVPALHSEPGA